MNRSHLRKAPLSLLTALAMVLSLLSVTALADGGNIANFVDENGTTHALWSETSSETWSYNEAEDTLTLNGISGQSLYFMTNEMNKTLHLILKGDNVLNTMLLEGYDLVISGSGTLTLTGEEGTYYTLEGSGTITVDSGTLNISAAYRDNEPGSIYGAVSCRGNLVLNGGTVNLYLPNPDSLYYRELSCGEVIRNGGQLNTYRQALPQTPGTSQEPSDPPVSSGLFLDVSQDAYYADAVEWAVSQDITSGTGENFFSPNASCTRAQTVTFLWRAAGSPAPQSTDNPFADVSESAYSYDAVLWAVEQGITSGTSDSAFSPDAVVTRGQTAAFLYRAAGSPEASGDSFADVDGSAYYADAVEWAVSQNITSGTGADTFSPGSNCTRAQIVTFLYRSAGEPAVQ